MERNNDENHTNVHALFSLYRLLAGYWPRSKYFCEIDQNCISEKGAHKCPEESAQARENLCKINRKMKNAKKIGKKKILFTYSLIIGCAATLTNANSNFFQTKICILNRFYAPRPLHDWSAN